MALLTITPPVGEPVSLAQMKQFARMDFPDDDTLWPVLISGARQWCEVFTQRAFLLQTKRLLIDFFPGYVDTKLTGQKVSSPFISGSNALLVGIRYALVLPYPRVRAVSAFTYQDANGNPVAMVAGTNYTADVQSQPARLVPPFGQMWPVARVIVNAVQVDYITGYGGTIPVSMGLGSAAITSSYVFSPQMVGMALSVPGAGAAGAALTTTISAVDGSGNATAANPAATAVTNAQAYLGDVVPEQIQVAIMRLALFRYENRGSVAERDKFYRQLRSELNNYRDLRF